MTSKKILSLILSLTLSAACLSACGGSDNSYKSPSTTSKKQTATTTKADKTEKATTKAPDAPSSSPSNDSSKAEPTVTDRRKLIEEATLQYPSQNDEWKYNVYDCYIELTEHLGEAKQELIVPNEIDGLPVWVYSCTTNSSEKTTSVKLPKDLAVLGHAAFGSYKALESIEIPNGVIEIGESAFAHCTSLKKVTLPSTLTVIDKYAFMDCRALESIDLPEGLVTIGLDAFAFTGLKSVTLPSTVKEIGQNAGQNISDVTDPDMYKLVELKVLSTDCRFIGRAFTFSKKTDLVIYGYAGSTAATYAADKEYTFKVIE